MSPYKSTKQRRWMHINKPSTAKRWDKKYGTKIGGGKKKSSQRKSLKKKR